jgi:hypothetical protein
MNRSILIVICDFLLVSLLAFSTVDINSMGQGNAATIKTDLSMNAPAPAKPTGAHQDLGDVMRLALADEKRNHDVLLGELTAARSALGLQQEALSNRESQIQTFHQQLQTRDAETRQLEQQQTNLQLQLTSANQQLKAATVQTVLTEEERRARDAAAREQQQKIADLQARLSQLQSSNQTVLGEKERLSSELALAESARSAAAAQLDQAQQEVTAQRRQNATLAEGVKTLAASSSALREEIQHEHPIPPNALFDDVVANRVTASFTAVRNGFFGQDVSKSRQTRTVLVTDGSQIFALCHVHDTPFALWNPGTDWRQVSVELDRQSATIDPNSLVFSLLDPRIVLMPITAEQARKLDCKIYKIASEPFQFPDAVVVGTADNYYGECKFQIDLSTPAYLKMDRHTLNGLLGKFNPSSGDLVFTQSGELLGIMANGTYCARIRTEDAAATFTLGPASHNQGTAETLADLYAVTAQMPVKLQ